MITTEHRRGRLGPGFRPPPRVGRGRGVRARAQLGFLFGLQGVAMYAVIGLAVALALTIAGSGMAIWYLDGKVEKAEKATRQAKEDLGREEQSRRQHEAAAVACSDSVEALARAGKAREDAFRQAMQVSRAATATAEKVINEVLTTTRPAGLDECGAMKKELDDEIDRRAAARR